MDPENFKKLSDSDRKIYITNFTTTFYKENKRIPTMTELAKAGVSRKLFTKLFKNFTELCRQCNIEYFRRNNIPLDDDGMRKYLESIRSIDQITGCWVTDKLAAEEESGRIRISYKKSRIFIYHASYKVFKRPTSESLYIMHKCDNEKCFNPEHLVEGTPLENSRDKEQKNRGNHTGPKFHKKHGLVDPYDYAKLKTWVTSACSISERNEWLYPYTADGGYAVIYIKGIPYKLHRLMLANKLGVHYDVIDLACHKFPENSKYSGETPARNDINPDHLYNGNAVQNANDALKNSRLIKITAKQKNLILAEAEQIDFSQRDACFKFDLNMATRLNVSMQAIQLIRTSDSRFKYTPKK